MGVLRVKIACSVYLQLSEGFGKLAAGGNFAIFFQSHFHIWNEKENIVIQIVSATVHTL